MSKLKQAEEDTRKFMANEFKEYNELTGLTQFKHFDVHNQHYLEVVGNVITLGYEEEILYKGDISGATGDVDPTFFKERLQLLRAQYPETSDNLELRIHGQLRRIAANINFRAKDAWNERVILNCDHKLFATTCSVMEGDDDEPPTVKLLTLKTFGKQCQVNVDSIYLEVDGVSYKLLGFNDSFRIFTVATNDPVDQLILPHDHPAVEHIHYHPSQQ